MMIHKHIGDRKYLMPCVVRAALLITNSLLRQVSKCSRKLPESLVRKVGDAADVKVFDRWTQMVFCERSACR